MLFRSEQMLSEYEDTQKVKLIDVGAFFLAGPFGVLATKGLDGFLVFDGLNQGVSDIKQFSMAFDIKKGDFLAKDVAFSVGDKRVAFNGGFSLSKDEYQNFVFALVNKNGCPKYAQMIVGKLQSPTVSKSQALLSQVLNPITSLFSGAKDLIFGDECKMPFYDGVVKNP